MTMIASLPIRIAKATGTPRILLRKQTHQLRWMASETREPPPCLSLKPIDDHSKTIHLLQLERTNAANAMNKQMLKELQQAIASIKQNPEIRCLILASASTKVFSAGADLKERKTLTLSQTEAFVTSLRDTFEEVANLPIPVIAVIEGVALGGGLELAMAADMRVAGENASLGLPETSLAIVPGAGGTQRLPRLIGRSTAKEMIFTGKKVDGFDAYTMGLVDHMVDDGSALDTAKRMAAVIAKNGPVAIRAAKRAINEGLSKSDMRDALQVEREAYKKVLETKDRLEGLNAFAEKRKPEYQGH